MVGTVTEHAVQHMVMQCTMHNTVHLGTTHWLHCTLMVQSEQGSMLLPVKILACPDTSVLAHTVLQVRFEEGYPMKGTPVYCAS